MSTFRMRVVRAMRAGWSLIGLGLGVGTIAYLLAGRAALPLALGVAALAIAIAISLNLALLVILWRRETRGHQNAAQPLAAPDSPTYEQPASL